MQMTKPTTCKGQALANAHQRHIHSPHKSMHMILSSERTEYFVRCMIWKSERLKWIGNFTISYMSLRINSMICLRQFATQGTAGFATSLVHKLGWQRKQFFGPRKSEPIHKCRNGDKFPVCRR